MKTFLVSWFKSHSFEGLGIIHPFLSPLCLVSITHSPTLSDYAKAHFYSGIKSYWIINNRDPVLQAVSKSKARRSAKCITSFDFSTLYTKIPHDKLITVLNKIIDFVFKGGTRNKISIHGSGIASWVHKGSERSSRIYTKESIIRAVEFLIRNCYFKILHQLGLTFSYFTMSRRGLTPLRRAITS